LRNRWPVRVDWWTLGGWEWLDLLALAAALAVMAMGLLRDTRVARGRCNCASCSCSQPTRTAMTLMSGPPLKRLDLAKATTESSCSLRLQRAALGPEVRVSRCPEPAFRLELAIQPLG